MKIAMLARNPNLYSHQRLKEAAEERGHHFDILNTTRCTVHIASHRPEVYYNGEPCVGYDAVIPRIGASITNYGLAILRQFEMRGCWPLNESVAIGRSRDKLRSMQILAKHGLGLPLTAYANDPKQAEEIIKAVKGPPVVIKLLEGTQGIGVILAPDTRIAEAVIETLQSTRQNVLIQRFVAESRGRDVRALVVGDRVVAAMRRQASGDEFRSNVHRGGSVEAIDLDPVYADTAVRAAQIMGLRVAGVDMLEGAEGPVVMEVNSSPGFEGIERATGLDIAGAIIDYVAAQVAFPEIDVRQRLSVSAGYGVVELSINEGAALVAAGTTIGELREQDISVLTLNRGTTVIPNPRSDRIIEVDDRLLCFGNLEAMRGLVPERRRSRLRVQPLPDEPLLEEQR